MVGDLPIMGLNSKWDDSTRANSNVPPLNKPWGGYDKTPARGVNLGGWLSIEPFITPSLFTQRGVVDEYTLCQSLGPSANKTIENHYATFVTEQTFKDIQAAGLDHVRIPFSYWAVETYPGDPYVFRTSWRYLLRGIEWARKYGLRVNLDVHGLPGSQNGWNHSGRLGPIGWLNGTDGQLNAQRSLDVHDRLSKFFAQDRYKNIITHYGLANEPRMTLLKTEDVVGWTETAYQLVRKNGVNALVIFGDGFMGLENWQGVMQGYDGLVLDVHQYVIFNENQIDFTHRDKIKYACDGWTQQTVQSMDTSTGYGPTLFAEWSQADTDCAKFLNNIGRGTRWEGTFDTGDPGTSVLKPDCPSKDLTCSCASANADPSRWNPAYKQFLLMFAEAQMHSFEKGYGWWYWTWKTESAAQWSYEAGLAAGVLPKKPGQRSFNCDTDIPDFSAGGLSENY
ncbi:putative glucan 1 [Escovopsis weberi]|uniref:glucan 1,3-beta-glucosidase n=1 Tax=Escovopsis weberi TaxID=150374 RepID=A0A0M8N4N0_ESCWE|nr:putative glucan 1 [Escovopsis weberi]